MLFSEGASLRIILGFVTFLLGIKYLSLISPWSVSCCQNSPDQLKHELHKTPTRTLEVSHGIKDQEALSTPSNGKLQPPCMEFVIPVKLLEIVGNLHLYILVSKMTYNGIL